MACKVDYSEQALESLTSIEKYLVERSASGARNVLAEIKNSIDLLKNYPLMGVEIQGQIFRFQTTRKYKYRVVYLVGKDEITIVQIYHRRQKAGE